MVKTVSLAPGHCDRYIVALGSSEGTPPAILDGDRDMSQFAASPLGNPSTRSRGCTGMQPFSCASLPSLVFYSSLCLRQALALIVMDLKLNESDEEV